MKIVQDLFLTSRFITQHPLNANYQCRALFNFMRWQIGMRLLQKKAIVPWVEDARFIAGIGETGLTGNIYAGFMEYKEMLFLLHALRPTDTFIDVGANIGAYTILASKVVGCRSVAFEPIPGTAERLKDQIQLNRIESLVDIRNMGVGDSKGELLFTNNNDTINKVVLNGEQSDTARVEVTTLDSEPDNGGDYFLKVDVEGFEYNVVQGAARLLASHRVKALIIELNSSGEQYGHSNMEIHDQLVSFDLIPISYDPFSRTPTRLDSYDTGGGNTIYVRNVAEIQKLCQSARRRIVHTAHGRRL